MIIEQLVNAIQIGSTYAVIAIAFTLLIGVLNLPVQQLAWSLLTSRHIKELVLWYALPTFQHSQG